MPKVTPLKLQRDCTHTNTLKKTLKILRCAQIRMKLIITNVKLYTKVQEISLLDTNPKSESWLNLRFSHDGAAAPFFSWLWGNLLESVRLTWIVCELGRIEPILV